MRACVSVHIVFIFSSQDCIFWFSLLAESFAAYLVEWVLTPFFFIYSQIIGNLLYYRYMNPAIVAPDAFDIIDLSAGGQLTTDQRRNLGSIAKMLQHAASNKMFLGDNAHLSIINEYLSQSYQKFR